MVYTGSFGTVANREDFRGTISLTLADGSFYDVTGAEILLRVCCEGNSSFPVLSAQTDDNSITIASDGSSFSWAILEATMSCIRPETYNIFIRMKLNDVWTQLVSASLTVVAGGPSS